MNEYSQMYYKQNKDKMQKNNLCYRKNKPEKGIYLHIKDRCTNPNNKSYKDYGERRIKCLITEDEIKQLWFRDKAYLLKQPSIDRKDNNENYTYDNCEFIELLENRVKDKRKIVLQYNLQENFIKKWISMNDASRNLKISVGDIWRVVNNKRKSAGGFIWKYNKGEI